MIRPIKNTHLKRIFALLISIFLIGTILLFRSYIVAQSDHGHVNVNVDRGCSVCIDIQGAEYVLRQMGMATKVIVLTFFCLLVLLGQFSKNLVISNHNSLVQLKIRMDH